MLESSPGAARGLELEVDGETLRMYAAPDDGEECAGPELLVLEAPAG